MRRITFLSFLFLPHFLNHKQDPPSPHSMLPVHSLKFMETQYDIVYGGRGQIG